MYNIIHLLSTGHKLDLGLMTHLICDKLVGVVYFHCAVNDPVGRTGLEIANLQNDHLEEQRGEGKE